MAHVPPYVVIGRDGTAREIPGPNEKERTTMVINQVCADCGGLNGQSESGRWSKRVSS